MTKKRLEGYRSNKAEIQELRYKLGRLGAEDSLITNDVILDYRTGYPRPQSVVGYDFDREKRLRDAWKKRIDALQEECLETELWIEGIPDGQIRRIFRMYYVDGYKQCEISKKIHLSQSVISEKISNYINSDKNDKKV